MKTALTIRRIPILQINPAPYNPRKDLKPGDPEYERLKRSMDEFGLVEPLVWNKRTKHLVGGHQRLKRLVETGVTHVDVSVVDLPLTKEKALNIALNKITGDWDQHKLAELLDELGKLPDFDLAITGFDALDAQALIASVLEPQGGSVQDAFDIAAELAAKGPVVTKPGDLITLGRDPRFSHRLLCGDCKEAAQVHRLMGDERAALFSTDPPYLVFHTGAIRDDRPERQHMKFADGCPPKLALHDPRDFESHVLRLDGHVNIVSGSRAVEPGIRPRFQP